MLARMWPQGLCMLMVGVDISTATEGMAVQVSQNPKISYNPATPLLGTELCVLSYCSTVTEFGIIWVASEWRKHSRLLLCSAIRRYKVKAGEAAQQVRALNALAEDWGSVTNTHAAAHNDPWLQFQGIWHTHTHGVHTHIRANANIHKIKIRRQRGPKLGHAHIHLKIDAIQDNHGKSCASSIMVPGFYTDA